MITAKLSDGLLTYDFDLNPRPGLAESWEVRDDGLRVTFKLREGVKWHDGEAFTSKDVAFSMMQAWKVHHGRGRSTFAAVTDVETPDPSTAVFVLDRPAPAAMKALAAMESTIIPAHVYEGTDILNNPANLAPVGTGPYRFVSYAPGEYVILEKNPDYWDPDLPRLDQFVVRFIADAATRTAMIEAGEAQMVGYSWLPAPDLNRLAADPGFAIETRGYEYVSGLNHIEFNLDNPYLSDPLVRQAIAHAVDRDWILKNIWYGRGVVATGPIHYRQVEAYTSDGVPSYPLDLKKAEALLDQAGYPRGSDGTRFSLTIDPAPNGEENFHISEFLKESLRQIGIALTIRNQDFGTFVKRVYTDRDFDMNTNTVNCSADPTIGVQRFYWSKNFKPGVAFSNCTHYANPKVDALLEAAQVENDADKRKDEWKEFQQRVMADLPAVPLCCVDFATLAASAVKDHTLGATGIYSDQAETWLDS
ncbi:ABC transporter substrate-binding protein [Consotaella aegiceratis]|uniref:ABC transporter substrate-binding protein n=1 Tax=Consotaella aegiceratis TaxID=3097961 RepID=UPI002F41CAE4